MDKIKSNQKKKIVMNVLYASLIGLLVVGCAVTIAIVNKNSSVTPKTANNGSVSLNSKDTIEVSAPVYVVPMKDYSIAKDYSGKELQYNDTLKQWEIHKAIDLISNGDASVFAISNGTVSNIYTNYLEGTVIEITHSNGLISIYKSLSQDVNVAVGDKVKAGQKIGMAGETMAQELALGKHLHLEITQNGTKVDPNDYIDLGVK